MKWINKILNRFGVHLITVRERDSQKGLALYCKTEITTLRRSVATLIENPKSIASEGVIFMYDFIKAQEQRLGARKNGDGLYEAIKPTPKDPHDDHHFLTDELVD